MIISKTKWKLLGAAFIIIATHYVSHNLYSIILIQGNSMMPAYRNMQIAILEKHDNSYSYGDVVAFWCDGLSSILIKRVVACPGDTVVIKDGTLLINDTISEVYSQEGLFQDAGRLEEIVQLNENQYIVIGDNVSESKDSRFAVVGSLESEDIIGKLIQ